MSLTLFHDAYRTTVNTMINTAGHHLRLAGALSAKLYQYPNGLIESAEYDRRIREWEAATRNMLGIPA